jgi:hypothetical protein
VQVFVGKLIFVKSVFGERDEQQIDKYHDPKKNTKPHVAEALEDQAQELG